MYEATIIVMIITSSTFVMEMYVCNASPFCRTIILSCQCMKWNFFLKILDNYGVLLCSRPHDAYGQKDLVPSTSC